MSARDFILIAYAVFLGIILLVNLLYFFQVFKYRLPGDASLPILGLYLVIVAGVIVGTNFLLAF